MAGHTGGAHLVKFHSESYTADPAQRGPVTGGYLRPPQAPRTLPPSVVRRPPARLLPCGPRAAGPSYWGVPAPSAGTPQVAHPRGVAAGYLQGVRGYPRGGVDSSRVSAKRTDPTVPKDRSAVQWPCTMPKGSIFTKECGEQP